VTFPALQDEYNKIVKSGGSAGNKVFRDKIAATELRASERFENAKSVVIVARSKDDVCDVSAERAGLSSHGAVPVLQRRPERAEPQGYRAERGHRGSGRPVVDITERVPLKLLAARSGLGQYGRNNLIFVDGMGSFNVLYAFLTDHQFRDSSWSELTVLDACRRCDHCDRVCPTYCITRGEFIINIDRCITLYNENAGAFPNWLLPSMHHALMGCMKCQSPCRVNEGIDEIAGDLGEVSEEETRKILQGDVDDALLKILQRSSSSFRLLAPERRSSADKEPARP